MTAKPKHDTLSRLLELLKALPHHRWATPSELRDQLADRGFDVDLRSVQRDLKTLQESFSLDHNDKGRPHGWRWSEQAAGGIAGMGTPEALMIVLVQQHLQAALPASMLEGFEALFARARQRLDRLGPRAGAAAWPRKVRALPPGLPMLAPAVDPAVQAAIAAALLGDRQIDAAYAPGTSGKARNYRLHPIGLVLRGSATYLVACAGDSATTRLYALHRFRRVELQPEHTQLAPEATLDAALTQGAGQFGIARDGGSPLALVLRCEAGLGALLQETPLAVDQALRTLEDGRIEVRAPVADSWELRWWILGHAVQVEVMEPPALRHEIADALRAACTAYRDD